VFGLFNGGIIFGASIVVGKYNRISHALSTPNERLLRRLYQFLHADVPPPNFHGNVYGCGILMDPNNKLTTFWTLNGILLCELRICQKISCIFPINFYIINCMNDLKKTAYL
jgi:hypothetical protein